MKIYEKIIFFLFAVIFLTGIFYYTPCIAEELTATQIIQKMDDLLRGETSHGTASMTITKPEWKRTISMENWSLGKEKFFIHITAPAREEGTTFLKDGNLLYQWVPDAEMRIKITPSMMLQSWMGSDFTNDDLVKESNMVKDYAHSLKGTEKVEGYDCYKIESIPDPDAPIIWGKLNIWVRKDNYLPVRTYFFDEKGNHLKTLLYSNFKQVNDRVTPMTMKMIPLDKPGQETLIEFKTIEFDVDIPGSVFTLENLEKPR